MINKTLVKENFSRYAQHYDKYCTIQNKTADSLSGYIRTEKAGRILDIGCGTGNYTKILKDRFPKAYIRALDVSAEMIRVADTKQQSDIIDFVVGDAEIAAFEDSFDLITSNAAFQWFDDLEGALIRYKKMLNVNGFILFSTFGPSTFYELSEALSELFHRRLPVSTVDFKTKIELEDILGVIFDEVVVDEDIYKVEYDSIYDLLLTIKYTGTRGSGIGREASLTRDKIKDLARIYKKMFKEITATYQIFFCKGIG